MMNNPIPQQNNHQQPDNGDSGIIGRRISFQTILFSISKRPWILIATIFVIMLPTVILSLQTTRMYSSKAVVMVPVQETTLAITSVMGGGNDPTKPEHYYTSILQSSDYKHAVGEEFAARYPEQGPSPNQAAMRAVGFNRDPRQPGLFTLTAVSSREDLVEPFVEVAVDVFRERISQLDQQEARAVVDFIDEQLVDINSKTVEAEEDLQNFLRDKQFVIENPDKGIAQELTTLESNLADAQANLNLLELNISSYERQIQNAVGEVSSQQDSLVDERVRDIRRRLESVKLQIHDAEERGAGYSTLDSLSALRRALTAELMQSSMLQGGQVELENEVSITNLQNVLQRLALERDETENRVNYLKRQVSIFRQRHPNISEDILEYTRLLRKRDVLKQTLEILLEKREEARIKMAAQLGGLKVLEDPTEATPLARHTPEKLAAALMISLVLGVVGSFVVDYSIQTIDVDRDITDNFKLPVLGVLPPIEAKDFRGESGDEPPPSLSESSDKLLTRLSNRSWFPEALRSVKTSLFFQAAEKKVNCIVITSPLPSEGKSLTSANLAISIAQSGKNVVLVDCDLRKPKQNEIFKVDRKPGISEHLVNPEFYSLEHVISTIPGVEGLDVIPSGSRLPNPAEVLGSQQMSQVLDELRARYDFVLLDSPPVLPAVDSRLLGTIADGLVLIAHAERTKIRNFENAINLIRNIKVPLLGTVLNQSSRKYGQLYYRMYGYYQSYYYYKPYSDYYASTEQVTEQEGDSLHHLNSNDGGERKKYKKHKKVRRSPRSSKEA